MESAPPCVMCGQPLESLSQRTGVRPFWQRFTEFLQLPFAIVPGFMLLVCTILPLAAPEALVRFAGWGSYFLAGLAGWGILQRTAAGNVVFPDPGSLLKSLGVTAVQVALLMTAVIALLVEVAARVPLATFLLLPALAVAGPVALVAVANEKGITGVTNTDSLKRVVSAMGFMILPAAGFTLMLMLGLQAVTGLLSDVASPSVVQCLRGGLYGYGMWVVCALAGYSQHQYRPVFEAHYEELRQQRARRAAVRRLDPNTARLELFLKEGMFDKAVNLMKGWSEKNKNNADIHARYFRLLVFLKDKDAVAWQGENYMAALLANRETDEAVNTLLKIQMLMPEFRPEAPEVSFDLAKACVERKEYRRASDLLDGLHQTAPHFPELAEAYMLRARLLSDKLQQAPQALEVMDFLVARFQKHPRYETMQSFWRQLGGKPASDHLMF